MRITNSSVGSSMLIKLKGQDWLERQRIAGKIAANCLKQLEGFCQSKTFHSMKTLNDVIGNYIVSQGGSATFCGYKGFPGKICVSINRALVHGIPDDTVLAEGDMVSFDLGVTYQGAIADTAMTCIFGKLKSQRHVELIKATEEALMRGIQAIQVGKRLGAIGNAISKYAASKGFSVVEQYGGHSLCWETPHAAPFVANKARPDEGIRLVPGLTLAIEPQLTTGSTKTWIDKDGWTVWCEADASAHFEHSVFIHEDHVEIITDRRSL